MNIFKKAAAVLAVLLVLPTGMFAQDFLKSLKEIAKDIKEINDVVEKVVPAGKSKQVMESDDTMSSDDGTSQARVFTVTTHHPDFKVIVKRCVASGNTVIIDMKWENVGPSDVDLNVGRVLGCLAIDDEGQQYNGTHANDEISIAVGKPDAWMYNGHITMFSETPYMVRVHIKNVGTDATEFRRLQLNLGSKAWMLNNEKPLTFKNIPINRN